MIAPTAARSPTPPLLVMLLLLAVLLGGLFYRSFLPGQILFSNDGPLGAISAEAMRLPKAFTGIWTDLNWVGGETPAPSPSLTIALAWVAKPVVSSKFFVPLSLALLGFSAWFLFRVLGFAPCVCALVGLAAALNMNTFSH